MEKVDLQEILSELHFTEGMSPATMQQLAEIADVIEVPEGTMLFREGDKPADLFLVRSGKVAIEVNVPRRGPTTLLTLGPGEFVGWSGFIGENRMTASAKALEDSQIVRAPAEKLKELSKIDNEFGNHFYRSIALALSRRLVATRLQLLDLFANGN
jgi:CRP-like cAMP-binding protein